MPLQRLMFENENTQQCIIFERNGTAAAAGGGVVEQCMTFKRNSTVAAAAVLHLQHCMIPKRDGPAVSAWPLPEHD